ncbi:hypothetical protein GCM10009535_10880 [Streptomyces thermocarboxydovorans]|uniref:Secreted protein n=1 Tax=Streptomyces thermocarboxydovorans TaxID=59298 RepID=A0ABN1HB91_9ACTN
MSDSIPLLLSCAALFLASLVILLRLARMLLSVPVPSAGHLAPPSLHVTPPFIRTRSRPRHAQPLSGEETRAVRPYVIAAEQAARRWELELAELGLDGPGPYVMHGVEVA